MLKFKLRAVLNLLPLFAVIVAIAAEERKVSIDTLGKMNLIKERLTISGFDSGGEMASQLQIAFSKNFRGVSMFASIWYGCSPYGFLWYREKCGKGVYKVSEGVNTARNNARAGKIDSLESLKDQRVYHWIPNRDELVTPAIRTETKTFYEKVGVKPTNIMLKYQNSFHIMPTANTLDPECRVSQITKPSFAYEGIGTAYCTYYGALEGLSFIMGSSLKKPVIGTNPIKLEPVRLFNQSEFLKTSDQEYMDTIGFYYVPSMCKAKACRLHVFLHGCYGTRTRLQSQFIKRSGYLEVAELNNIIMLFPQSIPYNGNDPGCWDVFGSTGENYAIKEGIQMSAIGKMLERVTGKAFFG